ncbi:MAG: DUF6108 family protein [Prevotella sp.]|nr:DUF6108 family protein [Prevotella sp.]MCI1519584.1 DUF6108 family protein [Prevotella sp.]MCI1548851.1 DUF6108 family protein [Prevotella sp.]
MDRRIILFLMFLFSVVGMQAQTGLAINPVFKGDVIPASRMVETSVRGRSLSQYHLSYYHSLRFEASKKELLTINRLFDQDCKQSIETYRIKKGSHDCKLIISLPPQGRTHRFLCLSIQNTSVTLVYMEGSVGSLRELRKLLEN